MIIPIPIIFFKNKESIEDKRIRETGRRLQQLNKKDILTIDEENEKRVLIGYPHLLEIVKEKCPKCNGKMVHDNFEKCFDYSYGLPDLKACYQCIECKYRVLFSLTTNKFDKKAIALGLRNQKDKEELCLGEKE